MWSEFCCQNSDHTSVIMNAIILQIVYGANCVWWRQVSRAGYKHDLQSVTWLNRFTSGLKILIFCAEKWNVLGRSSNREDSIFPLMTFIMSGIKYRSKVIVCVNIQSLRMSPVVLLKVSCESYALWLYFPLPSRLHIFKFPYDSWYTWVNTQD